MSLKKLAIFYIFDNSDSVEVNLGNDIMYITKEAYQKTKENCINAGYTVRCDNEHILSA